MDQDTIAERGLWAMGFIVGPVEQYPTPTEIREPDEVEVGRWESEGGPSSAA